MTEEPAASFPFGDLPEGTVTFLFSDIEGSTKLLYRLGDQVTAVLAEHHRILREAVAHGGGRIVRTEGDAFFVAFPRARNAVAAAVEAQRGLAQQPWPEGAEIRVRMGLHTGEPEVALDDYVGLDVHRAARIAHVGSGGQVLLSETTAALAGDELPPGVTLLDLGRHLLKDIRRPERIYQLRIEVLPAEFPPLKTLGTLPPEGARLPRPVGACPYRGLAAFREADAPFYCGREAFVDKLEEAVRRQALTAVIVGSSGSGKSSALFAGLLPRLRGEGGWRFAPLRPGTQPFYALAGALLPLLEAGLSETDRLAETRNLAERLANHEVSLVQVVARIHEKSPDARQILLVVDQFEELYTLGTEAAAQQAFIDELLAAAEASRGRRPAPCIILLTLRADFMGQALAYRPFADALQESSLLMGPMTRQELRVAIEKPAEMQGAALEAGLVERILDDVGDKPGNLPLLEFTLTLLWERQTDGWLTHTDYEAMGGVEGALATYADQVYAELQPEEQESARRALVQLVRPGEGTEDTRRVATREELGEGNWQLIQHLADRRLVVTGRDDAGRETAEVVHEALIQGWGRFQQWMDADRAFRAWQEQLRGNLRQWQESDQDEGALLAGAPLLVAENWLAERGAELSEAEQQFIRSGVALEEQRAAEREAQRQRELAAAQRLAESEGRRAEEQAEAAARLRRRALLLAGASILAVILAAVAFLAFRQASQNAQAAQVASARAEQEQAAAEAEAEARATQQALAVTEAEARATQQTLAEEQARLATSRELAAAAVNNLQVDPERSTLLALEALKEADTVEGQSALHQAILASRLVAAIPADSQSVFGVAASPDGSRFAAAGMDGLLQIWAMGDLRALSTAPPLLTVENPIDFDVSMETGGYTLAFSPDGSRLAVIADQQSAKIYDASTGRLLQTLSNQTGNVYSLAFDPDGKRLVTTSAGGAAVVWDVLTGDELLTINVPETAMYGAVFTPDGKWLITGSEDAIARFWDLDSSPVQEMFSLSFDYTTEGLPGAFAFSPDGEFLAVGAGAIAKVWDFQALQADPSTKPLLTLYGHQNNTQSLGYTHDGSRLVTGNMDGTAKVWDAATGQELFTLAGGMGGINSLAISPDGMYPLSAHSDGQIRIWDISPTGSQEWWAIFPAYRGHISLDGKHLATAYPISELTGEWQFQLWALSPSGLMETHTIILNPGAALWQGGFAPDLSRYATVDANAMLKLWEPTTGQLIQSFPIGQTATSSGHDTDFVFGFDFSPEGTRCATGGDDSRAIVWDLASGEPLLTLTGHEGPVRFLRFSPDGTHLATSSLDGTARMWDTVSGELVQTFSGHEGYVADVEFSPDGKRLLTGSGDGTAKVWDILTGRELLTLRGHVSTVFWVDFAPDGTRIATGSTDGSAKVWDASTGQALLTFPGFVVEFAPDGKSLMAISLAEMVARGFHLDVQELTALARSRVTRSLTNAECQQYLHLEGCPSAP